jgi:hypothetical protein
MMDRQSRVADGRPKTSSIDELDTIAQICLGGIARKDLHFGAD